VLRQEQLRLLHHAVDVLVVHSRQPLPIQQGRHPPVAVVAAGIDDRLELHRVLENLVLKRLAAEEALELADPGFRLL
jgi:hypothetical protein